jgi:hypothetical protein
MPRRLAIKLLAIVVTNWPSIGSLLGSVARMDDCRGTYG